MTNVKINPVIAARPFHSSATGANLGGVGWS